MPTRHNRRTYRTAVEARARVLAAQAEQAAKAVRAPENEPMHRWPHPIPEADPAPTADDAAPAPVPAGEPSADLTQILEQLNLQSQLLVDLLGAVNALTATVLVQVNKN